MAVPKNKNELLEAIRTNYTKLEKDLIDIPIELTVEKELDGHAKGTKMSICNLVAYLIGWGELVLKWNMQIEKGEVVDFPEVGYKWTELGLLAQKFYSDYSNESYEQLLEKLDKTVRLLIKLVEKNTNDVLYKTIWYKVYPMGRMIQLNTSSPYKNARIRVRKWKKERGVNKKKA